MTQTNKTPFVSRFGQLVDVTERMTAGNPETGKAPSPYVTFKMQGTKKNGQTFDMYGAAFNADIVDAIKAALGQSVWMYGPNEKNGDRTAFKAIKFKISEPKAADAPAEAAAA